jgi:hypothetical protein
MACRQLRSELTIPSGLMSRSFAIRSPLVCRDARQRLTPTARRARLRSPRRCVCERTGSRGEVCEMSVASAWERQGQAARVRHPLAKAEHNQVQPRRTAWDACSTNQ